MKTKSVPTGNVKEHKDTTIAEYTDGSWRYMGVDGTTKGAIAIRSLEWKEKADLAQFNKETSLAAYEAKKDKRREIFKRGIVTGTKGLSERPINSADEAFEFIVEKRTEVALSGDSGSLADAKWIDEALHGDRKQEAPRITIHIDNATLQAIQHVEERNIIEGEFVEQD